MQRRLFSQLPHNSKKFHGWVIVTLNAGRGKGTNNVSESVFSPPFIHILIERAIEREP